MSYPHIIHLDPGSVGAILVGRSSSLGDSHILPCYTVSRHCHPGQLETYKKTKTQRQEILISYMFTAVNSPCCDFLGFSNPLRWFSNPLQHPEPPSR